MKTGVPLRRLTSASKNWAAKMFSSWSEALVWYFAWRESIRPDIKSKREILTIRTEKCVAPERPDQRATLLEQSVLRELQRFDLPLIGETVLNKRNAAVGYLIVKGGGGDKWQSCSSEKLCAVGGNDQTRRITWRCVVDELWMLLWSSYRTWVSYTAEQTRAITINISVKGEPSLPW